MMWENDMLDGYVHTTLPLHDDDFGPVVATLTRPSSPIPHPRFVVLAIHGWNDYFYQLPHADAVAQAGGAFYAIDLRRYGRSWREGQTWGYIEHLSAYDDDIHAALDVIHTEVGTEIPFILYGHSTGGLTASLWASRHPEALDGLVLNSPWLEYQGWSSTRVAGSPLIEAIYKMAPSTSMQIPDPGIYTSTLARWNPDPRYRHTPSFPIYVGWLRAIAEGHKEVANGLGIDCPTLVLTSARSAIVSPTPEQAASCDIVLDVEQIWKRLPRLGSHVTLVKLDGAIHDVLLSDDDVRERAIAEINTWVNAYVATAQ
ncbi:alpha-beta hydrolase superfamily lysophospholipase [Arcanobacterium wilhelmae]|uniref:Alpha-beta hydrolase superfamily lysophospholipase n=1 Tax=Arcanobacterium wilhelmae TaxID=1803177 RepID=A0ABT9NAA7_9ACTO|nr:alpha/beta hydrolase [Arcanobacterium wilhelmae]MDP9800623.1 alpha-beta hydrolase superfamily lysophospholipase [Arcanobacterium wilhelmae]WFN90030.1 alpha/beta hydrolase [Arcanobacterium wilhelmae]